MSEFILGSIKYTPYPINTISDPIDRLAYKQKERIRKGEPVIRFSGELKNIRNMFTDNQQ